MKTRLLLLRMVPKVNAFTGLIWSLRIEMEELS